MSRLIVLLLIAHLQLVINVPLSPNEKQTQTFKIDHSNPPNAIPSHNNEKLPILVPVVQPHHVTFVEPKLTNVRKKKGPNFPLIHHHLLAPTTLHVIPIHSNFHQNSIHAGINHIISNNNVPIVSHSYSHGSSNATHPTQLIPILIPIHTHLVPLHDLTVIPLHRDVHHVDQKLSHYRASMEKKDADEEEPINRFRSFYGGFGNGLYIGGHGAGHGFYSYG
ncbi:uncharacterized protein LOC114353293 [Ostrinia furnacalis]|uniref:uncharacterized protein LOC114353293 n=1 Tax=Ostrinia furnacalis TaxID=93504 RepID=UPI0010388B8B|nr:uncharacterized protein LOC114353293 [Ostrinia furnacalis]